MALNTNYGYPPTGYSSPYSSPYSSTPTGIRTQRPRFGYSGLSMYPRSRSSASDVNAESFSDSMINNYGTSTSRIDSTFNSENRNSYNDSYNTSNSNYYSANSTFSHGQSYEDTPMMRNDFSLLRDNVGLKRDNSMIYKDHSVMRGYSSGYGGKRSFPRNDIPNSLSKAVSKFDASEYNYNSTFGNAGEFKRNFQKNSTFGEINKKTFFPRKQVKPKKMAAPKQSPWRCELCSLDFTSQIPYDMHFRGAKHAKKIKTKEALAAVQSQTDNTTVTSQDDKKSFFCELCNVKTNSSLQLQTHLEGSKHKNKLQPKEVSAESQTQEGSKDSGSTSLNGKTNGSLVRTLPSDFGEPQPSKLTKFACEICNVAVNSEAQLQQHLSSKKHQNKVEGRSLIKVKRMKKDNDITSATDTTGEASVEQASKEAEQAMDETEQASKETEQASNEAKQASNETATKVVGVKTLASSFVQGETLQ